MRKIRRLVAGVESLAARYDSEGEIHFSIYPYRVLTKK